MTLSLMHPTTADNHMAANEHLEVIEITSSSDSLWPVGAAVGFDIGMPGAFEVGINSGSNRNK